MAERWLPVVGYEGVYEVSDLGRVRSLHRAGAPLILKQQPKDSGHLQVDLHKSGVRDMRQVHALVIEAFEGPRPSGLEVRHRNGIETDNQLSNLEYSTRSRNGLDKKWHRGPSGTCTSKLSPADVREIKGYLGAIPQHELGRMFGVSQTHISRIKRGIVHRDVAA